MFIKQDMDFGDLMENCWSGAIDTLKTIEEHDKEKELMEHLESIMGEDVGNIPTITEVNDYLLFDSDFIFEALGISETEGEEEEEEINCKNQSCVDCYKYVLGECEGI